MTPKHVFELARNVAPIANWIQVFMAGKLTWEETLTQIVKEMDKLLRELMQECERVDALKTPGAIAPERSMYADWTSLPVFDGSEDQATKERLLVIAVGRSWSIYKTTLDAFMKSQEELARPFLLKLSARYNRLDRQSNGPN